MEPFSISCTTCRARLKVRDDVAIGKILACPKCGSMVMVERPSAAQGEVGPLAVGAVAAPVGMPVGSTFDDLNSLLADEPGAPAATEAPASTSAEPPSEAAGEPPAQTPEEPSAGSSSDVEEPGAEEPVAEETPAEDTPTEQPAAEDAPTEEPAAEEPAAEEPAAEQPVTEGVAGSVSEQPLMPDGQWISPHVQLYRKWFLLAGAAVTGIVLAVAMWGFLMTRSSNTTGSQLAIDSVDADPKQEERPTPPDQQDPTQQDPTQQDPADSDPLPTDDDDLAVESDPATDDDTPKPPEEDPAPDEDPAPEDDPATDEGTEDDPAPPTTDVPVVTPDPVVEESEPSRPPPPKVDVEARLAENILGFEGQIPLTDFLQFVSDISTIPITLEPEALKYAGVAPEAAVNVSTTNVTVAEVLDEVLATRRLGYTVGDGHLIVARPVPAEGRSRRVRYDLSDMGGDSPETLDRLGKMLRKMIDPDSWEPAGPATMASSGSALIVRQTASAHFKALVLCEKLRIARGQPPKSRFDRNLFRMDDRTGLASEQLAAPVTINFSRPTRLVKILARLKELTGATILVDWRAAAQAGHGTTATATLTADGQPLGEALQSMLDPMDLTYRIVDDSTLQITTPQVLKSRCELELYALGDLLSDDVTGPQLTERIEGSLGADLFTAGLWAVHFDPQGECLIARLPQPKQQQLRELLRRWRKSG